MVKNLLKAWPKRLLLLKISKFAIAILLALSVTIVGLSIYVKNVGNFVISIEEGSREGLTLSENNDFFSNATTLLYAAGIEDAIDATYLTIPTDVNDSANGNHNDAGKRYSAYTFYLKNSAESDFAYTMKINIAQLYKNVDGALRVLVITDGTPVIYAKRNPDGSVFSLTESMVNGSTFRPYETVPFADERIVCDVFTPVLVAQQVVKYTIVLWLEGWDEDCVDSIKGGAIRLTMNFAVAA